MDRGGDVGFQDEGEVGIGGVDVAVVALLVVGAWVET